MSGYRTWTPGEVITAGAVQSFLMDQTVMVFPSDAVRATAVVVPTEGMLSWNEQENLFQYFSGSAWENLVTPIEGGVAGQAYVSNGTAPAAFQDVKAAFIETTLQNKSANYTAVSGDTNTVLNFTAAATVTVPDVLSAIGDRIDVFRNSAGTVFISAGTGVTSWAGAGTASTSVNFFIDRPFAAASVIKTGASEYRVIGQISA